MGAGRSDTKGRGRQQTKEQEQHMPQPLHPSGKALKHSVKPNSEKSTSADFFFLKMHVRCFQGN